MKGGNSWLIPVYTKNSKKFQGSFYVDGAGNGFYEGPTTYKGYKEAISKK